MSLLFQSFRLGTLELPNRLVMPPIATMLAERGGRVSKRLIDYYARRAEGGAGLIAVEILSVDPVQVTSPHQLKISDDSFIPGLAELVRAVKARGARVAAQLHHPGRQTSSRATGGVQPVAPSAIPCPLIREMPRELTKEEIAEIIERFAQGARRAREAGFDAVEFHGAHGYLICQFLSPFSNKRTDEYGGDVERRARFALEIVKRTRELVGRDYPIIFRISAEESVPGGLTLDETRAIARMLEEAGVDCLSVSAGNYGAMDRMVQPILHPVGCLVPLAAEIKKAVKIPVIAVGRINDARFAERVLREGKADLIAMGRPLLADPDLPRKSQEGRYGEVRKCIACNICMDLIFRRPPIACLMNPEVGKEGETETPAEVLKKVLILGAGPAGLEAARVAHLRGHKVTLWEQAPELGGRWSWLIKPYIKDRLKELQRLGVRVELGKEITPEAVAAAGPDVVLATVPASPVIPDIPGIKGDNVLLADDVLEGRKEVTGKVVVLGGGNIGCEVAMHLVRKGVEVSLVEHGVRLGSGIEPITRRVVLEELRRYGVRLFPGHQASEIKGNEVIIRPAEGEGVKLEVTYVILALGSRPDEAQLEKFKGDYELIPIPFCERPQDAFSAGQEGIAAARRI